MIEYYEFEEKKDLSKADALAAELDISLLTAKILCKRGYDDIDDARRFLHSELSMLGDPFQFKGMQDAIDCIDACGQMGGKICIYGDYDTDGICGTAILSRHLSSLGFEVIPYIPERHNQGYGLNCEAIDDIASMGADLLITVDCGITAIKEIEYAYKLGMEVVLTDHHQCPPELPECEAIINPKCGDYPFEQLCGAGVALKIVQAMGGTAAAEKYLDMAAIATVADIVNLTGENRVIVSEGLRTIAEKKCCIGVQALMQICISEGEKLNSSHISFLLAPRINAMGRTGSAEKSLRLFLTDDMLEAKKLAYALDDENKKRQMIEVEIVKDVMRKIDEGEADLAHEPILILQDDSWNIGVIGIVASRLAKRFNRPILLLGSENGNMTASGRSIHGIHLYDNLKNFGKYFLRFGGHEMAVGLTIKQEDYENFRRDVLKSFSESIQPLLLKERKAYDFELMPEQIGRELYEEISVLAPFGTGHCAPIFLLKGVRAENVSTMGSNHQHLRFNVDNLQCVAFGEGHRSALIRKEKIDLLVVIELNRFNDRISLQIMVKSMRLSIPEKIDEYIDKHVWKFYDAISRRIGYNEGMELCDNMPISSKEDIKNLVLSNIRERQQGNLLLCFTPETAKDALKFLKKEDCLEEIEIVWGEVHSEGAYNTILLAPDLERSSLKGFDRLFILDNCPDAKGVELLRSAGFSEIYSVGEDSSELLEHLQFEREALAKAYRAILLQLRRMNRFVDFDEFVHEVQKNSNVDTFSLAYALRVFAQLMLLCVKQDGSFRILVGDQKKKCDLLDSSFHRANLNALAEYRSFCVKTKNM